MKKTILNQFILLGVGISISAAHASIEAFLKENETCTIEVLNTNHAYCYEHDNVIYNFFEDKYQSYGENYFINNWNGRFYFMVDNF